MNEPLIDPIEERELFLAGQWVPGGLYREIERYRQVHLDQPGVLPASLDGRIACYARIDGGGAGENKRSRQA